MELQEIRNRWNDVLDAVLAEDRISWLAFFDARLAEFDGTTLTLDFSDTRKLSAAHEYSNTRVHQQELLIDAVKRVLAIDIKIVEK